MHYRFLIALIVLVFSMFPTMLQAQDNTLDLRYEFNEDGRTYSNFIYVRTVGKFMIEAFHLEIPPENEYKETAVGVGWNILSFGDLNGYLLGHIAAASDEYYFQPTFLALDVDGKWTGSLFVLYYGPLGDDGIHQFLVNPVEIAYNIYGPVSFGFSSYLYKPEGGDWLTKLGLKFGVADRYGVTELRVSDVNNDGGTEFQLRRIFVF